MSIRIWFALLLIPLAGCSVIKNTFSWDAYQEKCKEMGYDWYQVGGALDPPRVVQFPGKLNGRCVKKRS